MGVRYSLAQTPWGEFLVGWGKRGIVSLHFPGRFPEVGVSPLGKPARELVRQLNEYLAGERRAFELPLALGGTAFQRRVWAALRRIPYGTTATYGEIARWVGRPGAARAVGQAVGANPIPIVIPCHRVVPRKGGIGNFGPGPEWKERLLRLEGIWG